MTDPESRTTEQDSRIFYAEEAPSGYVGETDRTNGEYHYKSGYTQKIYTDASFTPESETTDTPHYYTPSEKTSPKPRNKTKTKRTGRAGKAAAVIALCLACAVSGGILGSGLTARTINEKIDALQKQVDSIPVLAPGPSAAPTGATSIASRTEKISDIYNLACKQTVGITTEITYMNFFGMTSSSAVSGTGFIVTTDGYILTNYHVVESAYKGNYAIRVLLHDGSTYDAAIVGFEESNDIAVLKIDRNDLTPVTFGNSDELKVGDEAFAVGNPLGELNFSMTFGRISALDRMINTDDVEDAINMFQLDAAVNTGNSGGPVYDSNGAVIGIVTAKYGKTGMEGLGFAIPINDALSIANDLITKGYVTGKAYLGVVIDERYTSLYSRYYNMPLGAYVYSVYPGTSAEKAGIQPGDIILSVGDQTVQNSSELKHALRQYHAGDEAELIFYRAGSMMKLNITFDEVQSSGGYGI